MQVWPFTLLWFSGKSILSVRDVKKLKRHSEPHVSLRMYTCYVSLWISRHEEHDMQVRFKKMLRFHSAFTFWGIDSLHHFKI